MLQNPEIQNKTKIQVIEDLDDFVCNCISDDFVSRQGVLTGMCVSPVDSSWLNPKDWGPARVR